MGTPAYPPSSRGAGLQGANVHRSPPLNPRIEIPIGRVAEFCQRNRIRRLALFGSVLRDDFTPESDVDVLVEFEPGARVGFAFITVEDELSRILGRRVDMNTFEGVEESRNWLLRAEILDSAEVVYDQAR